MALVAAGLSVPAMASPLTLDEIILLSQSGIGDEAVVAKVKNSATHMDLSVDQILDLKKKGVSGPVIAALLEAPAVSAAPAQLSLDSPDPAVPHAPGVYLLNDMAQKMVRIDPTVTNQAKTGGLFGYALTGGIASMSVKAAIQNASARTHTPAKQPTFYFFFDESNPNTQNAAVTWASGTAATVTSAAEFTLVHLMEKSGRREARVGSINLAGAKTGVMDKDRIGFDYQMVRPGVFRVQPTAQLAKGEYGFIYSLAGGGAGGAVTARIFDFAVD
ncbi:hypothetical protein [Novosphingobium sp. EMRT-2]|uniref:hypothetical protein n=1 Tax=Novosphingobium sp. EMRT-2 TaxID=2571749 RepID=UPI0021060C91|nr:hypothetical protein [Novosphingobium sp. EMRT-2]